MLFAHNVVTITTWHVPNTAKTLQLAIIIIIIIIIIINCN